MELTKKIKKRWGNEDVESESNLEGSRIPEATEIDSGHGRNARRQIVDLQRN